MCCRFDGEHSEHSGLRPSNDGDLDDYDADQIVEGLHRNILVEDRFSNSPEPEESELDSAALNVHPPTTTFSSLFLPSLIPLGR